MGLLQVCIRRFTSSACLGLLLRDLQVPGGGWCYTWAKVPPAASNANKHLCSCSVLLLMLSLNWQFCLLSNSAILTVQVVHGQDLVSGFTASAFTTSDHRATNSTARCDLLHQLTARRTWNQMFPWYSLAQGHQVQGILCLFQVLVGMCCNHSPHPLFTTASSHLPGVDDPLAFTHIFTVFCPNISLLFCSLHLHQLMVAPCIPGLGLAEVGAHWCIWAVRGHRERRPVAWSWAHS